MPIEFCYFVMERMAAPISEAIPILLDSHNGKKKGFTKIPMGDVAVAMLNCLQAMHNNGNLVIDVKTENFMLSSNSNSNAAASSKRGGGKKTATNNVSELVRLIDFGLVERYNDMSESKHRADAHPDAPLVGTPTYASLNVSSGHTPSRRDDLESLGYVLAELILLLIQIASGRDTGKRKKKNDNSNDALPWSHATSDDDLYQIKVQEMDVKKRSKSKLFAALKGGGVDTVMSNYFSAVMGLPYSGMPEYDSLKNCLKKLTVTVDCSGASSSEETKKAAHSTPKKKPATKSTSRRTSARRKLEEDDNNGNDSDQPMESIDDENLQNRKGTGPTKKQKVSVGKESAPRKTRSTRKVSKTREIGIQTDKELIDLCSSQDEMDWEHVGDEAKSSAVGKGILKLDIIEGPHKGEEISIGGDYSEALVIGKDTESRAMKDATKFSLTKDASASPVHAKFVINTKSAVSSVRVTDMSSTSSSGTFINGICLANGKSKQAFLGDKIKVGESTLQIKKA